MYSPNIKNDKYDYNKLLTIAIIRSHYLSMKVVVTIDSVIITLRKLKAHILYFIKYLNQ